MSDELEGIEFEARLRDVMSEELEGYTHEEFCALLDLMQVKYVTRDPLARSPKDRMKIINYFRSQKRAEQKVQEFLHEI